MLWTELNGESDLCGLLLLIPEQANRLLDSRFLELNSGFQSPGLRVPQAKFHRSGILITYHGARQLTQSE